MYCKRILFWFFVFDSEGNLESFSNQGVTMHKHVVPQLVNYGKYNQTLSIGQWEEQQSLVVIYYFFPFIYHQKKAVLCIKALSKTSLEFWKDIKMIWNLPTYEPLKYFRDNKKNTNWPIIIFSISGTLFENRCYICKLESCRKFW